MALLWSMMSQIRFVLSVMTCRIMLLARDLTIVGFSDSMHVNFIFILQLRVIFNFWEYQDVTSLCHVTVFRLSLKTQCNVGN